MTKLGYLNSFPKEVFEREEVRMDPCFRRAHYQLKNQSRTVPPQRIEYRKTNTASNWVVSNLKQELLESRVYYNPFIFILLFYFWFWQQERETHYYTYCDKIEHTNFFCSKLKYVQVQGP